MPMVLTQEMVQPCRNIGGNVSLAALLTNVRRDIFDDNQFFALPDLQCGRTWLQPPTAQVASILGAAYLLLAFRVL